MNKLNIKFKKTKYLVSENIFENIILLIVYEYYLIILRNTYVEIVNK